jgi:hypothetical protein
LGGAKHRTQVLNLKGCAVATRRSTFGKQDRERQKKARAAEKRERRHDRTSQPDNDEPVVTTDATPDQLLREIEVLHARFDAKAIDFETFEERKLELFTQLASLEL